MEPAGQLVDTQETTAAPRPRALWRLAILVFLAAVVATIYAVRIRTGMADFSVNYTAARRLWAGETLYQVADGHWMFKYLPASAILYLPLAALPLPAAKGLWFALSLAALVWSFQLVQQLIPERHVRRLSLVPALVLAKYFLHELRLGQINILVAAVMLLVFRDLSTGRGGRVGAAAGIWSGIATVLKPYSALLFPYLVLKREWTAVACGLCTILLGLAVPSMFYGISGNSAVLREWAASLAISTPGLLPQRDNVSVLAFFAKWTGDPGRSLLLAAIVLAALALVTLAVIVRGRLLPAPVALEGAMILTLIPLVSPMAWDYTFLMSLPAVTILCNYFSRLPSAWRAILAIDFAVIGLSIYDLMGRAAYAAFMNWSVTTVNFVIVVLALAYLRLRRVC
jgi:alpha-1,2-mannosyltransferase